MKGFLIKSYYSSIICISFNIWFLYSSRIPKLLARIAPHHSFSAPQSMLCFLIRMLTGTWALSHTAPMERIVPDAASNISSTTRMKPYEYYQSSYPVPYCLTISSSGYRQSPPPCYPKQYV